MEQFAVKVRDKAHIYIHNTLEDAAWFLKEEIEERIRKNERPLFHLSPVVLGFMIPCDGQHPDH
jgi:hypothetical protein